MTTYIPWSTDNSPSFIKEPYNQMRRPFSCNFDVTDNKTDYSSLYYKNFMMNNANYNSEDERLKTFNGRWKCSFINKNTLAQIGMYFTGCDDKVKCYFCEVEIGRWEETDDPVNEHMKFSPNCPLLRRRTTNNIPLDAEALDRLLPPATYDVCGSNDVIEIRPSAYAEGSISTSPSSFSTIYPEHPEYAVESARLRSYTDWPSSMKQKPEQLSEAGFFYTGIGDRVKCFSCGGGLKDWDDTDEPWEQHALWLSCCRYLKLMKGQSFIDSVLSKYKRDKEANEHPSKEQSIEVRSAQVETSKEFNKGVTLQCSLPVNEQTEKNADKKVIPEEKLCKICYASEYNTAFLPCGHVVACAKCASSVTKCPMCRKPFTDIMRVYFS